MSLLETRIKSIQLFKNLTLLPQLEVCKQLNSCSLILVSLLSEKWEKIVNLHGKRKESIWEITLSKNVLMIYLKLKDEAQNFQIGFKEDPNSREDFYFEYDQRWNCITCYYKSADQLEASSFKALNLLSFLFPPTFYHRITVPLGPRSPDFPFRFLSQLPRAAATFVDLQADLEVECGDLTRFLDAVGFSVDYKIPYKNRLDMKVRVKNLTPCDEITIRSTDLKISDARFLTYESIQKLDFYNAEIGENNFTSKDFNAFFRSWMLREKKARYRPPKITFDIREDQNIKMEEVMEGLNAHVGKPRLRDRWKLEYKDQYNGKLHPTAIDCDKGWDIIDSRQLLGTVLLEPNRLSFLIFSNRSNCEDYVRCIEWTVMDVIGDFHRAIEIGEKLKRDIVARGLKPRRRDLSELAQLPDILKHYKQKLEVCFEAQENIKLWDND